MYSDQFRQRFGPEALAGLHGIDLLQAVLGRENRRETLSFWLEYKNDSELPDHFGSIRGLRAPAFGLAWSVREQTWLARVGGRNQPVSTDEAIRILEERREQVLRAVDWADRLLFDGGDPHRTYNELQRRFDYDARDLRNMAWFHKYLTLLYPKQVDNYHTYLWQRFHLLKLWQEIPPRLGRYQAAAYYVDLARRLNIPLLHLTYSLNQLHGRPYRYWAVAVPRIDWQEWLGRSFVTLDDRNFGPVDVVPERQGKPYYRLRDRMYHPQAQVFRRFSQELREDHLVLAIDGGTVLGVGRVTGPYEYSPESRWRHRRPVTWLSIEPFPHKFRASVPFSPLNTDQSAHIQAMVASEGHSALSPTRTETPPFFVESITVKDLGRLKKFRAEFPRPEPGSFGKLNISVIVGENGTGKTTLLRFLSEALNQPDKYGDHEIAYSVRGERTTVACENGLLKRPTVLPEQVLVSTFSPFEQYARNGPSEGPVRYRYLGTDQDSGLESALVPIVSATLYRDRSTLSQRDLKRQAALVSLLEMVGCKKPPEVVFKHPTFRGRPVDRSVLTGAEDWQSLVEMEDALEEEREAVRQVIRLVRERRVDSPDPADAQVSLDDLRRYPGGVFRFIADLQVADSYGISLIADLVFDRAGQLVPLSRFSSGELSLLYRCFRVASEISDEAIVIIDEPETHLHPRWILRYISMLTEVFGDYRAHIFLATHSPFLAADVPHECIVSFRDVAGHITAEPLASNGQTLGTNPLQVLNEVFGVWEYTGEFALRLVAEIRALIAEGQLKVARQKLRRLGDSALKLELYLLLKEAREVKGEQR